MWHHRSDGAVEPWERVERRGAYVAEDGTADRGGPPRRAVCRVGVARVVPERHTHRRHRRRDHPAGAADRAVPDPLAGLLDDPGRPRTDRAGRLRHDQAAQRLAQVAGAALMSAPVELEVGGRTVRISNPDRVYFPARGETKLDLARYYLSVADGAVRGLRGRPCMLHRFPTGVTGEKVHQKRLPRGAPDWVPTVRVHFPRWNRYADELCVAHPADVIWAVQMSTVEFHPWNSRAPEVEKPDEWRI